MPAKDNLPISEVRASQFVSRDHTANPERRQPHNSSAGALRSPLLMADGSSAGTLRRPLLMVDIDGVISLFGWSPAALGGRAGSHAGAPPGACFHWIDGIPHFLSSIAAEHLLALSHDFELVWASGWEEKANEYLPHLLGLPALPHLSFERAVGRSNAHWKLDAIEAYAGGRALAWIDDAFNDACHEWASERAAATLLVETQPASGLTEREAEILRHWASACAREPEITPINP
ncbi:MAG: HAD domain-containing protein [Solirubrobacteraceae bacterium]